MTLIKIGFIVNPIAGMGGRVGLKGTDGVLKKAKELGAKPVAPTKASETIKFFSKNYKKLTKIKWYTCKGEMGEKELTQNQIPEKQIEVIYAPKKNTAPKDTKEACKKMLQKNIDLILFWGGDGTARDIYDVVDQKTPLLGIPSGVKMHSGVFGINIEAAAKTLKEFLEEKLTVGKAEIMDLDEKVYRKGEWKVKLFGTVKSIEEPNYVQVGKASYQKISDQDVKDEIAEHIQEEMEDNPEYIYLFGSGGTIDYIADKLEINNTLLGIDAIKNKKNIGKDLNEKQILEILKENPKAKLILSPIGAQGFILGRGNLQLSPDVVRKIKIENIIIVSTPAKLNSTPRLRVDTGDKELDKKFRKEEFLMVVIGYRLSRVVKIQTDNI
ncbi:MAG: ATP-NAD kinase family protein [Candidatus Thermoplasmatota archaeon]